MKRLLFLFMTVLFSIGGWAEHVVINTNNSTNPSDWSFTQRGQTYNQGSAILTWGFPNSITVTGAINQDGLNFLNTQSHQNGQNGTCPLDLSNATLASDVTTFPNMYTKVVLPPNTDPSGLSFGNSLQYAISQGDPTHIYAASGISVNNITELGTIAGQKFVVCGPGQEALEEALKAQGGIVGGLEVEAGSVATALANADPTEVTALAVVKGEGTGTLTSGDISFITGTLTSLESLDISETTAASAEDLWTLLNGTSAAVTLGDDNIALLKTLSGKTFTPAILAKIADSGFSAATLIDGMTTTNYFIDGTTLTATGTLSDTNISEMTTMTGIDNIDISNATATAALIGDLLDDAPTGGVTLGSSNIATLKNGTGQTIDISKIADSGVTAATLIDGMTTTNYIIDGTTLIVTGNIDSTADSDIADIISDNSSITNIDASHATNTTPYEITDKGSQITQVSLPTSGNVTYGGSAITLVDGVLEISIDANDPDADYATAAAALSGVLGQVEHLKITGTLTTQDIDDLFASDGTAIGGYTNIKTLDLTGATLPSAAECATVAESTPNATAVLLPAGTDLSTGWSDWGTNFFAANGDKLNAVVNNASALPAGNYFAEQEEANTLKVYDGKEQAAAATALSAYQDFDVSTIDLTAAAKRPGPENDAALNSLRQVKTVLEPIEIDQQGKVKIRGSVNPDIIASLNEISCSNTNFNTIDLSEATLVDAEGNPDNSIINNLDNSCLQYLMLPPTVSIEEIGTLKDDSRNPNLIAAGSYQNDGVKNLNAWMFTKGNMSNFIQKFDLNPKINNNSGLQKLTLGGEIAVNDIMNGNNKRFGSTSLHEMDLTNSSFESCNINTGNCYSITQNYVSTAPSDIGNGIASNALFYLRNYGLDTCALPDPSNPLGGNTEIPPHTFSTSNSYGTIANITIPEGYTKIGTEAFWGHQLTELVLPGSLREIGVGAFASLTNNTDKSLLTEVTMHSLTGDCVIDAGAFARNINLKHVTLSEGILDISNHMFDQCYQLESVRIPTTCATIGERAFYECVSMHTLTIPEGVEEIYSEAFELSGIVDLYLMASSPEKAPKIYCATFDQFGGGGDGWSTFTTQRMAGFGTIPDNNLHPTASFADYEFEDIVNWYQAELSDPKKGLGTGRAYIALHYPDNMKPFYEGINPLSYYEELFNNGDIDLETYQAIMAIPGMADAIGGWVDMAPTNMQGINVKAHSTQKIDGKNYLPEAYSVQASGFYEAMRGPDKDGKYYPTRDDLLMRMAAGLTSNAHELSQWGWRQFPLAAAVGDIGRKIYDRDYDYTWYTMCFPWHLSDEQLFMAFQPDCEIVEFVGAEVILQKETSKEKEYALVLHFDDVAQTYYMDNEDKKYERENIGTREFSTSAGTSRRNVYRYTEIGNPSNVIVYPLEYKDTNNQTHNSGITVSNGQVIGANGDAAKAIMEAYSKYLTVINTLALAGHPYMIHPAVGAPGQPTTVTFTGIKVKDVFDAEEVTRLATTGEQHYRDDINEGATEPSNDGGIEEYDGESAYTFVGYMGEADPEDGTQFLDPSSTDDEYTTMPALSYFLAVRKSDDATASENDKVYPKYYRKKADAPNTWRKYTAIIKPNDAAIANIEANMDMTEASANGFNIAFGEWEIVTPTAIEEIVEEAERNNEPVQRVYLNVVYNVKGQVVRTGNSLEGLPKGLYIVNGKKYMVK